ncbi:family 43 glycosylhydrolase [Streptomyces sp. NPDC017940]|uniref:family 43 glycosylhydrolase n=1 Tax=Streptomyces sp. NPDC017940 TaxID=3365017 RepID=UPI0037A2B227
MRRRVAACGLTAAALILILILGRAQAGPHAPAAPSPAAPAPAPTAAHPADGPVLARNFPDPDIVKVGRTYHAYATNGAGQHVQHATSADLTHWRTDSTDVLPALGAWAVPDRGLVWAPEVYDNGAGFTLHYTARDRASDRQCIGVALSQSPEGPFRPVGAGPLICPAAAGGAIDAASYTENGRRYVLWKNDGNCCGLGADTWLHLQPTSWDGTRLTGGATRLVKQDREWEDPLVEAPTLVRRGGRYVLFYSAHFYSRDQYRTGYAVAERLTGPYTKAAGPLLTTDSFAGAVRGPGGQDVVTGPDGRDRIVFHGWNADYTQRFLYAADLGFADGRPVVRGSKSFYEAEDARVLNAAVREAPLASGGRAVGGIDHADSHVEFRVFAASAGAHTLFVRYGNGSLDGAGAPVPAAHRLTVNGTAAGVVPYPHTGWDRWRSTAGTPLVLRAGWNTVRLSKDAYYAELDGVDVA